MPLSAQIMSDPTHMWFWLFTGSVALFLVVVLGVFALWIVVTSQTRHPGFEHKEQQQIRRAPD